MSPVCWAADLTNGMSGAWDDRVTHEVEPGIIVAASCGCCEIRGIVESGSGRASSCELDGNGSAGCRAADAGREVADTFAGSSIQVLLLSVLLSLSSIFITRRRHSSGAVCS